MKEKAFCSICGSTLALASMEGRERQVCTQCLEVCYENPLPAASVILPSRHREVLLVRREREPFKDMWCLPIGFAETGESIEDAALRELEEETGVKGGIVQLVDVSSHKNPLYGDLLIVTFEAEKVGGEEKAGDDASECAYFPVMSLPRLAFDSQEKAIRRFVELKKDLWKIHDSLEVFVEGSLQNGIAHSEALLSDELVSLVQANSEKIADLWLNDVTTNPATIAYQGLDREDLFRTAVYVMGQLKEWLRAAKGVAGFKNFYATLGAGRRAQGVPLEEMLSSLNLLKKHIWMFTYSSGVWEKPLDTYRVLELVERLVFFFDRAGYYIVTGYYTGKP